MNKYPCRPTCDCRLSEKHKLSTQHCSFAHALPDGSWKWTKRMNTTCKENALKWNRAKVGCAKVDASNRHVMKANNPCEDVGWTSVLDTGQSNSSLCKRDCEMQVRVHTKNTRWNSRTFKNVFLGQEDSAHFREHYSTRETTSAHDLYITDDNRPITNAVSPRWR